MSYGCHLLINSSLLKSKLKQAAVKHQISGLDIETVCLAWGKVTHRGRLYKKWCFLSNVTLH